MGKRYQILNIVGFIGILLTNYLAVTLPLAGNTTGELAALYPSLFTPAGFTFSIWSVIYLALLAFIIIQSGNLFAPAQSAPAFVHDIGIWFFLNALCNVGWLFAWHYRLVGLSVLIMLGILTTLLVIYRRLRIGDIVPPAKVRFGVHLPFQLYLGWITVATIANLSALLVHLGWEGEPLTPVFWTVFMIGIGTVLGAWMLFAKKDIAYALVLIWAFYGIFSKRSNADVVHSPIVISTLVAIGVLLLLSVYTFIRRRQTV